MARAATARLLAPPQLLRYPALSVMITTEDLGALYRAEAGRILATLIRVLGDFDLAEEVLQEAFAAALAQWPSEGAPDNPRAWLTRTARNKAIDHLRHRSALLQRRENGVKDMRHLGQKRARHCATPSWLDWTK